MVLKTINLTLTIYFNIFFIFFIYILFYSHIELLIVNILKLYKLDRTCPKGMVKCGDNIQCMFETDICNSHPVCSDGSDEDPQVCTKGK